MDNIVRYLDYMPPFRSDLLLGFLEGRGIEGVERVDSGTYSRIVRRPDGEGFGWVLVEDELDRSRLKVEISPGLSDCESHVLERVGRLFDVDCDPAVVEEGLSDFYLLADDAFHIPGVRVPCSFDGFEMSVRAVLGQQITVRAASTLAGRIAKAMGEEVDCPIEGLATLFPPPSAFCPEGTEERLGELGVVRQRAHAICELARLVEDGNLSLSPGADVEAEAAMLLSIRGIGPWTVQYLLMRAYDHPDAFLPTDYGVKMALPGFSPRELETMSQRWKPWRSYAVMSMWSVPHSTDSGRTGSVSTVVCDSKTSVEGGAKEGSKMDYVCGYDSPLGRISIASDGESLVGLWFSGQKYDCDTLSEQFEEKKDDPAILEAISWLDRYFAGEDPGKLPPCAPRGTAFRQMVWKILAQIPYGSLTTYGAIAKQIEAQTGHRTSARAVGGAVGHNPISIILPCHRVVGTGGSPTGYAGGLDVKVSLLKLEGVDMSGLTMPR